MTAENHDRLRLDVLATIVRQELAAAGLPVIPGEQPVPVGLAGAVVKLDVLDPRGVQVDWRAHAVLLDANQDAWAEDPLRERGECEAIGTLVVTIDAAMAEAMRKILTTAGLEVTSSGNDYAPDQLLVTRCLAPSPWQARRDARFERQQESIRAAWQAQHEAECPNHGDDTDGS
jgi:hypothetical protein